MESVYCKGRGTSIPPGAATRLTNCASRLAIVPSEVVDAI